MEQQPELTPEQRGFHMAEFQKLNGEIAELIKSTSTLLTFAVGASGALFAWLLKAEITPELRNLGFAIPTVLTLSLGSMAYAQAKRIEDMGSYLRELENRMGERGLGWEKHFKKKAAWVGHATRAAWAILLVGNILGALAGACLAETPSPHPPSAAPQ